MQAKHARQPAKAAMANDMEAYRSELARAVFRVFGSRMRAWRSCGEPMCRRARACQAPEINCGALKTQLPMATPEQSARTLAQLKCLKRMLGVLRDAEAEEAETAAASGQTQ